MTDQDCRWLEAATVLRGVRAGIPSASVSRIRLFLVRHGQVSSNRDLRYIGSRDEPLTDLGRRQGHGVEAQVAVVDDADDAVRPLAGRRLVVDGEREVGAVAARAADAIVAARVDRREAVVGVGVVAAPGAIAPPRRVDVDEARPHRIGEQIDVARHADHGGEKEVALDAALLAVHRLRSLQEARIEILQGTLDLLVLQTLQWGPQHGYGIAQAIQASSSDVLQVDTGSLYPALHRLEKQGWISATWKLSPNKQRTRVYRLTAAGRKQLASERSRWERLVDAMSGILARSQESEA